MRMDRGVAWQWVSKYSYKLHCVCACVRARVRAVCMHLNSWYLAGLATVGGVCQDKYACVIAELGTTNVFGKPYPSAGFTSVYILAHEIGHKWVKLPVMMPKQRMWHWDYLVTTFKFKILHPAEVLSFNWHQIQLMRSHARKSCRNVYCLWQIDAKLRIVQDLPLTLITSITVDCTDNGFVKWPFALVVGLTWQESDCSIYLHACKKYHFKYWCGYSFFQFGDASWWQPECMSQGWLHNVPITRHQWWDSVVHL